MTQRAQRPVCQRLEGHRGRRRPHACDHLGQDLAARVLHPFLWRGGGQPVGALCGQLAREDQFDQVGFADLAIADGRVGRRGEVVGENHGAARMGPEADEHGREVGIARQDDELVEIGIVHQQVANVHDHADVGRVLQLRGERRAVDHLEPGAQEVMAHEREGVHVGGVVVLVAPRHRIAVAAVHHDPAGRAAELRVGRCDQPSVFDLAQPGTCILGKSLGGILAFSFQRQVDVVIVDKECAEARPARFPFHFRYPHCGVSSATQCKI